MAVQQCAHFSNDQMILYERVITRIVKYLMETAYHAIVYNPEATKGIEFFVDVDFDGGWNQLDADNNKNMI